MSFTYVKKLPTPEEICEQYPMPKELAQIKATRDQEIKDVLTGVSDKLLVIIGPCSADNEDSVCEYVSRLSKVNEKVKDKLILIPRIYTRITSYNVCYTKLLRKYHIAVGIIHCILQIFAALFIGTGKLEMTIENMSSQLNAVTLFFEPLNCW